MSQITYNGVTLPYPHLTEFRQDAVGDEMSNTDWCYSRYDITVQTLINPNYLTMLAPDLATQGNLFNAAQVMDIIRNRLLQRRKKLTVTFNGVDLVPNPQTGNAGVVDAKNGPIPQYCNIIQLENLTFLMNYKIIAHYWENLGSINIRSNPINPNKPGSPVLYNRWTESVDLDNCMYSTRTREGKLVIRSDNTGGLLADNVRTFMAVVGIPDGFLRQNSHYTVSPDGLGISYRVVDKEVFKKPPSPAFEATGEYTEVTPRTGAGKRTASIHLRLKGAKTTTQPELINTAIKVASAQLFNRGQALRPGGGWNLLESATLTFGLYENWVDFTMRVMIATDNAGARGVKAYSKLNTTLAGSDGVQYTPPYTSRGTSNLLLQAAAYYDPSIPDNALGGNVQTGDNISVPINTNQQLKQRPGVGTLGKTLET